MDQTLVSCVDPIATVAEKPSTPTFMNHISLQSKLYPHFIYRFFMIIVCFVDHRI